MAIPVVTCNADIVDAYSSLPRACQLGAAATGSPSSWRWEMRSVPTSSTANVGVNGDFTDGVAVTQNPQFTADVDGAYVCQAVATNGEGPSEPDDDQASGQQIVIIKTQALDMEIPGEYQYDWPDYMNRTLKDKLEAVLANHSARHEPGGDDEISGVGNHASTHQDGGADEISVAGLSGALADPQTAAAHASSHNSGGGDAMAIDAAAGTGSLRTLGTAATAACAGDDSRLSDSRTPTSHATSHQSSGGDAIKLDDLASPDDNTDLDTTAGAHGLCPKLSGSSDDALRGDGTWGAVASGGGGGNSINAGEVIEVYEDQRSATVTVTSVSGELPVWPESGTLPFTVNIAGEYRFDFRIAVAISTDTASVAFRIVFDEGESYVQEFGATDGSDDDWLMRGYEATFPSGIYTGKVELTAGSHTVKAYCDHVLGAGTASLWADTAPMLQPKLTLVCPTAGINPSASLSTKILEMIPSSDITLSATVWTDVGSGGDQAEATVQIPTAGYYVLSATVTSGQVGGSPSLGQGVAYRFVVDDDLVDGIVAPTPEDAWSAVFGAQWHRQSHSFRADPFYFTAGSHTVKLQYKNREASRNVQIASAADESVNMAIEAVSGSGLGGTVLDSAEKTADQTITAGSVVTLTELDLNLDTTENESVDVSWEFPTNYASATLYFRSFFMKVDAGGWEQIDGESCQYEKFFVGSTSLTLGAGSHVISFAARVNADSFDVLGGDTEVLTGWGAYPVAKTRVVQNKGGQFSLLDNGADQGKIENGLNFSGDVLVRQDPSNVGFKEVIFPVSPAPSFLDINQNQVDTTDLALTTSYQKTWPRTGDYTFNVPAPGYYKLTGQCGYWATSYTTIQTKLTVDGTVVPESEGLGWVTHCYTNSSIVTNHIARLYLEAGDHTYFFESKETTGSSAIASGQATRPGSVLIVESVSGSGLGGSVPQRKVTGSDRTISATAAASIPSEDMTIPVNTIDDEWVDVEAMARITSASGAGTDYISVWVDAALWGTYAIKYVEASRHDQLVWASRVGPLGAGSHTIELRAHKFSGGSNWVMGSGSWISVNQEKGGQISLLDDGTDKGKLGTGINFTGLAVSDDAENIGYKKVELPSQFSAPGQFTRLVTEKASAASLGTSYTQVAPDSGSHSFSVQTAGPHKVKLSVPIYIVGGGTNATGWFKVEVDGGGVGNVIGDDRSWAARVNNGSQYIAEFSAEHNLTVGDHTAIVYGKEEATGDLQVVTSSAVVLTVEPITGSGLGGTIIPDEDHAVSDVGPLAISTETDLISLDTGPLGTNDSVSINFRGTHRAINTTSSAVQFKVYVGAVEVTGTNFIFSKYAAPVGTDRRAVCFPFQIKSSDLGAGTHTIKITATETQNTNVANIEKISGELVVHRGGTHPVYKDGVLVGDKPTGTDYIGPNLDVFNSGGMMKVKANLQGAGVEPESAALSASQSVTSTSFAPIPTTPLTFEFEGQVGETVILSYGAEWGSASAFVYFKLEIDGSEVGTQQRQQLASGAVADCFPYTLATSGTHTLELLARVNSGSVTVNADETQIRVHRIKGGYQTPESIPWVDMRASGGLDTFSFGPGPGAENRTWISMNDGARYYYDGTYSMDLSGTGLGGKESSLTWPTETSGTGDSLTAADGNDHVTLTDAGASFDSSMIGAIIRVDATTTAQNSGWFLIVDVLSSTQLKLWNGHASAGAETSSFTWSIDPIVPFFNYAVPDPSNPGQYGVIASRQSPDAGGPADYTTFRYMSPGMYRGSTLKIRAMAQTSPYYFTWLDFGEDFPDGKARGLEFYGATAISPGTGWFNTHTGIHTAADSDRVIPIEAVVPIDVCGAIDISGNIDEDADFAWMVIGTGDVLFATGDMTSLAAGCSFLIAQSDGVNANRFRQPITDKKDIWMKWVSGAAVDVSVWCMGFEDKYLYNNQQMLAITPPKQLGEAYVSSSAATTTAQTPTWTTLAGTFADGELTDFTRAGGVLTYNGSQTKKFRVEASISGSVDVADTLHFALSVGGTPVAKTEQQKYFAVTNIDGPPPLIGILELSNGNTVEVEVTRAGASAVDFTAEKVVLTVTEA